MTNVWSGLRLYPTGSLLATLLDINLSTTTCTPNTPPISVGNCPTGIDSMGRTSSEISASHIDVNAGNNSIGILANGTNNLGATVSPTVMVASAIRMESGGSSEIGIKALSSSGVNITGFQCTMSGGGTCFVDDAASTRNMVSVGVNAGSNVTVFNSAGTLDTLTNGKLAVQTASRFSVATGTALIDGDFALSAGWGSTRINGSTTGFDQAFQTTVTAQGTGILPSPTITLTFKDGTWGSAPICESKMNGGTGAITPLTDAPTAGTDVITFTSTPVAGKTYIITGHCWGIARQ